MSDNPSDNNLSISIIIPVYGVEEYIDRFLKSLMSQTVQCFRAVFVNDKTPDASIDIVEKYRSFFRERLIVINNEKNLGLSGSRNVGLDYVSKDPTKYVTFLDPDDWIDPDYLEDLYSNAERNSLELCIAGLVRFNDITKKTICVEMTNMRPEVFETPAECRELAYINPCAYAKLYLFAPIRDLRFRSIKRSEDTCYLFEALRVYNRIMFTNNARYHYCVRDTSLTGAVNEEKYESMHQGFAELMTDFGNGVDEELLDQFVCQIFIRSSLGGVCRICFKDMRKVHVMERKERTYLDEKIPSWRKNRYLCFGKKGIGGKKEFALRTCASMYKMHVFFSFIWIYFIITKISGKDFRA